MRLCIVYTDDNMHPKQQSFTQARATYELLELHAAVEDQRDNIRHLSWCITTGNFDSGKTPEEHVECLAYCNRKLSILLPCLKQAEALDRKLNPVVSR